MTPSPGEVSGQRLSRREFLKLCGLGAAGTLGASCAPRVMEIAAETPPVVLETATQVVPEPTATEVATATAEYAGGGKYSPEQQPIVDEWTRRLFAINAEWTSAANRLWGEGVTFEIEEYFADPEKPTLETSLITWRARAADGTFVSVPVGDGQSVDTFTFPHPNGIPVTGQIGVDQNAGLIPVGYAPLPIRTSGVVDKGIYKGFEFDLKVPDTGFAQVGKDGTVLRRIGPVGEWVDVMPELVVDTNMYATNAEEMTPEQRVVFEQAPAMPTFLKAGKEVTMVELEGEPVVKAFSRKEAGGLGTVVYLAQGVEAGVADKIVGAYDLFGDGEVRRVIGWGSTVIVASDRNLRFSLVERSGDRAGMEVPNSHLLLVNTFRSALYASWVGAWKTLRDEPRFTNLWANAWASSVTDPDMTLFPIQDPPNGGAMPEEARDLANYYFTRGEGKVFFDPGSQGVAVESYYVGERKDRKLVVDPIPLGRPQIFLEGPLSEFFVGELVVGQSSSGTILEARGNPNPAEKYSTLNAWRRLEPSSYYPVEQSFCSQVFSGLELNKRQLVRK